MKRHIPTPTDASIIVTYRCPMNCIMCNTHSHPTKPDEEFRPALIDKLPKLKFINITGGEPFCRDDIEEIVDRASRRASRIVISTSGFYQDKIVALVRKFPNTGIRVSLEGLAQVNDTLRGRSGSFDRGLRLLIELARMGIKDIGFGTTISDSNSSDMLRLYEISRLLNMEFATAVVHNSFYFHTTDNAVDDKERVTKDINTLVERLLGSLKPKNWFRAYFNCGLIAHIHGKKRLLPCEAGSLNFFLDPKGEVYPCNGMEKSIWLESMGNLSDVGNFDTLWKSEQAVKVRNLVGNCPKNCWMIGTAAPAMKRHFFLPFSWVMRNKIRLLRGKKIIMPEACNRDDDTATNCRLKSG
jgi:radical SAM protein with 4Fe4S-binding SPASM domain